MQVCGQVPLRNSGVGAVLGGIKALQKIIDLIDAGLGKVFGQVAEDLEETKALEGTPEGIDLDEIANYDGELIGEMLSDAIDQEQSS
jgi:hypothetical protein